ncbi:MAG: nicotinamide mononucleotide transporter [Sphingomonadales bacterium]|nr:nicotinamide mononucleotide transporter [Sphingomonadales bacterium]
MNMLEVAAVVLGLCNIALLIRRSIWNYPFGIAMVLCFFFVFRDARLYSDMLLQLFFAGVQMFGWWSWARSGGLDGPVEVGRLTRSERVIWPVGTVITIGFWGWAVASLTNGAAPWWDAAVAMTSVAAQLLLIGRRIENWIGWIIVNILSIGLYFTRDLYLTAGLYVVFLALSVVGYREWLRVAREQDAARC